MRALLRGVTVVAIACKLLVPVGYMPSALADGGPFTLCGGSGPAGSFVENVDSPPHGHDSASSGSVHAYHHAGAVSPSHAGHGHDDESLDHGHWERCALGGLASLAPLAADLPLVLPSRMTDERPQAQAAAIFGHAVAVVRSRGPPHSRC